MGKGQIDCSHHELQRATRIFEQDNKIFLSLYLSSIFSIKGICLSVCISCNILITHLKSSNREVSDYLFETTEGKRRFVKILMLEYSKDFQVYFILDFKMGNKAKPKWNLKGIFCCPFWQTSNSMAELSHVMNSATVITNLVLLPFLSIEISTMLCSQSPFNIWHSIYIKYKYYLYSHFKN